MNTINSWQRLLGLMLAIALGTNSFTAMAASQLPDFTYQGRLTQNGVAANGSYNLSFELYNDAVAGSQVGSTITDNAFPVVNGLFNVSLAFPGAFTGTQLWLQVSVNGTPMLPRQAVSTTPVAQYALSGVISGPASGDLTGSYPNPAIATGAVTNSKIAAGAITASKLAGSSVTTPAIAVAAVTSVEIASGAVGTPELANDAVTRFKLAGGYATGAISLSLSAGQCKDFQVAVGGAQVGDMAFFNMQESASLPPGVLIMPINVSQAGAVFTRFCNVGGAAQTLTNLSVYIQTLR